MSAQLDIRPRRSVSLEDKYVLEEGIVFLSGVQALVRVLLDKHRADARQGLRTATLVSGYQGSPLGGFDKEVMRLGELAARHEVHLVPGLNEELAATAVYGSQLVNNLPGPRYDGVLGVWYGKNPGLDRAIDPLRHANYAGADPAGGMLAFVGDDPSCKSSTLPSASQETLASLHIPTFFPGTVQEILDLGAHAIACSRASGLVCALKMTTNVADGAGTAEVSHRRVAPVLPAVEWHGETYRHQPSGNLLAPASMELEQTLFGPRLELARRYAAANSLNPITVATAGAWLGIVAAGHTYYELVQALRDLGLRPPDLERAGVRLMRVGVLYPHDRDGFRELARGVDEVLVVEEKAPFLETALRDALYGGPDLPLVVGKADEEGRPLVPAEGELAADAIALAVAARLERRARVDGVRDRADAIGARVAAQRGRPLPLARTPFFCSGCPHNSSTGNPDDTLLGVGIGCHTMVVLAPEGKGTITGITQMGGEGAQFAGIQPFVDANHFVQNMGDGTFHHSGSLAMRAAVAAETNVTYKLLYNDFVAMTGGQEVVGQIGVPQLTRWLALEGVRRVIVTTENPKRYRGVALDPIAEVRHRDEIVEAQAELARIDGVTVLIHDQACAAELRRMRKRGKVPEPPQRIHINERVCEGCGDCGQKSSCLSVLPVETEFGRKTQIHQSSCNKDYSCVKGDCPSFVEVIPGKMAQTIAPPAPADLPNPQLRVPTDEFVVRMPGIGGTGVVTVSQILQMAALLDGRHAAGLDQTGLAQKGGPVISDIRISSEPIEGSNKASSGGADLLLGLDLLGAAHPRNLTVADPARTVAVVNTALVPTAAMVTGADVRFTAPERHLDAIGRATRAAENLHLDAQSLSEALFGDHMPANLLLIGAAYQHGCLPLSAQAITQAIRLNGAAVEKSLAAFAWGRAAVAQPDAVEQLLDPQPVELDLDATSAKLLAGATATGELQRLLRVRIPELIAYQSTAYAREYLDAVMAVLRVERQQAAPGQTAVSEAFARGLYKFMAYKDEYEVARLHLDAAERARLIAQFGEGATVRIMLHPPLLRALGLKRKLKLGPWFLPVLRLLRSARHLRGTPLDVFGRAKVRRVERELITEYRQLVERSLAQLSPATHAQVAAIAELPDIVRGYEDIKLRNVERFRAEAKRLEADLAVRRMPRHPSPA
jgi:indolepyruvate ferredoxin oxidoreductase